MPNRFVKSLISFSAILIFAGIAAAQSNCGLTDAPGLIGLKIGMSPVEVSSVFGKDLKFKVKNTGERSFFQNYIDKPAPNALRGVRALYLRFLDGKLYRVEVFYEDRTDWQTLADLTKSLSAQFNIADSLWQIKQNKAVIDCTTFTVVADKILNPHIEITDETTRAKADELRKKKAE